MSILTSSIIALPGYCLIEPRDETEKIKGSAGTFITAESVKDAESQRVGTVLSIGDEMTTVYGAKITCPPQIKVGSIVAHKQIGYDNLKIHGKAYKFIPFNDLVGVIKE